MFSWVLLASVAQPRGWSKVSVAFQVLLRCKWCLTGVEKKRSRGLIYSCQWIRVCTAVLVGNSFDRVRLPCTVFSQWLTFDPLLANTCTQCLLMVYDFHNDECCSSSLGIVLPNTVHTAIKMPLWDTVRAKLSNGHMDIRTNAFDNVVN